MILEAVSIKNDTLLCNQHSAYIHWLVYVEIVVRPVFFTMVDGRQELSEGLKTPPDSRQAAGSIFVACRGLFLDAVPSELQQ